MVELDLREHDFGSLMPGNMTPPDSDGLSRFGSSCMRCRRIISRNWAEAKIALDESTRRQHDGFAVGST